MDDVFFFKKNQIIQFNIVRESISKSWLVDYNWVLRDVDTFVLFYFHHHPEFTRATTTIERYLLKRPKVRIKSNYVQKLVQN